ncbi:MAG: DEAD/DEAH box helicase [Burkholderiales bacterium]|nr:DEAD/DEAH box helicase [Burkholderiales bacterium]
MARKPPYTGYVDIHGRPIDPLRPGRRPSAAEPRPPRPVDPADLERVFDALALAGWQRSKTTLATLLRGLAWQRADGHAFGVDDVGAALHRLREQGRVLLVDGEGWSAERGALFERLPALLADPDAPRWWRVWAWAASGGYGPPDRDPSWIQLHGPGEAVALMRLVLASGIGVDEFERHALPVLAQAGLANVMDQALAELHAWGLGDRVDAGLHWRVVGIVHSAGLLGPGSALLAWADAGLDAARVPVQAALRLRVAGRRLHAGDAEGWRRALAAEPVCAPWVAVFGAAQLALDGRFAEAIPAFEGALKGLAQAQHKRRPVLPLALLQWQLLALLAQPDAKAWQAVVKTATAHSGSRNPDPAGPFGCWAHAAAVRLGDARLQPEAFEPGGLRGWIGGAMLQPDPDRDADRLVLAAWLGHRPKGWSRDQLDAMTRALHSAGMPWKADLLAQACERLGLPLPARPQAAAPPWPVRFFTSAQDAWREALAAIVALGEPAGRGKVQAAAPATLRWVLALDEAARPFDLHAFEPAASARGRPKLLTLAALKKRTRMDPRDAAVARCIRSPEFYPRQPFLDLSAAVQALVGHPGLYLVRVDTQARGGGEEDAAESLDGDFDDLDLDDLADEFGSLDDDDDDDLERWPPRRDPRARLRRRRAQALAEDPQRIAAAEAARNGSPVELIEALPALQVRRERAPGGVRGDVIVDAKANAKADVKADLKADASADADGDARSGAQADAKAAATGGDDADARPDAGRTEHFVFELEDDLLADRRPLLRHHVSPSGEREAEADRRDALRIVSEASGRVRLLRISPAQRRVAELVAKRWSVPVQAQVELDAALRVLAAHFLLHSDADAGEPVSSDARLIAQLQPRGGALQLQLLVQPFGDFGPLLVPGSGRQRLMTVHAGASLTTLRDAGAELDHLAAALAAMPMLGDELPPDASWVLDDPEDALAVVHALSRMGGAEAPVRRVEWPKGRPLRVTSAAKLRVGVSSGRDWLALEGALEIDAGRVVQLQQLLALLRDARGQRFIALGEGDYLALDEQLRQRLAELDALGQADGERIKVGASAAAWLADAADTLGVHGDAKWRERAQRLAEAAALDPQPPRTLQAALRPYQAEGHAWMRRLAHAGFGGCLADDMGLGKTVQTLALLLDRATIGPALVVAPTSVCANWAAEAARFAPALELAVYGQTDGERSASVAAAAPGQVVVVSYALLLRDAEVFAAQDWATLVLDEAQALKNAATQRAQVVAGLRAGFRLALSGTPVENRLADLWSLMNLLNPGLLGNATRFQERFAGPIERHRDGAAQARLRRLVAPFLLRRTKAQVLSDLPPRTEIVHRIEPPPEERSLLEALRREALERMAALDVADRRNTINVLAELMRLRRAACDPRLAAPELGLVGAKVRAFEELAAELVAGGHQALVFSQFTDFLRLLAERLDAAGLRYQLLDGSTPAAARADRVAAFQRGEAELFLISLKAGGFGLNLTAADYVVIADPWWNPAAEDQAMGRAHRIGQLRPVTVYRLVTAGSIEERIVALHRDKRELADGLLEGQDRATVLQPDELMDLLRD